MHPVRPVLSHRTKPVWVHCDPGYVSIPAPITTTPALLGAPRHADVRMTLPDSCHFLSVPRPSCYDLSSRTQFITGQPVVLHTTPRGLVKGDELGPKAGATLTSMPRPAHRDAPGCGPGPTEALIMTLLTPATMPSSGTPPVQAAAAAASALAAAACLVAHCTTFCDTAETRSTIIPNCTTFCDTV